MSSPNGAPHKAHSPVQSWTNSLFGCFSPFSTCIVACCLPCVTYGKTRHRIRNDGDLGAYSACNGSCMLECCACFVGLGAIPIAMQRSDIRHKYNLSGNCCLDITLACCCGLCDMVQQDKEVALKEGGGTTVVEQYQPQAPGGMTYPVKQ